jgi:hypothetical protein
MYLGLFNIAEFCSGLKCPRLGRDRFDVPRKIRDRLHECRADITHILKRETPLLGATVVVVVVIVAAAEPAGN